MMKVSFVLADRQGFAQSTIGTKRKKRMNRSVNGILPSAAQVPIGPQWVLASDYAASQPFLNRWQNSHHMGR
jgi:hypothetical protein